MLSIWSSLADLPDQRTGNARRHNLLDVLTIALTATICGAESCVDFADFARDHEALRWSLEFGQADKLGSLLKDGPDDGQAEAVFG